MKCILLYLYVLIRFPVNPSLRVFEIPAYHEKSLTLDSSPCLTLSLFSDLLIQMRSYQNESSNLLRLAFKSKEDPVWAYLFTFFCALQALPSNFLQSCQFSINLKKSFKILYSVYLIFQ